MPLTVLSVAYPLAPVGPNSVGGAEQVLSLLDRALALAGDRSVVIGMYGSQAAGKLLPIPQPNAALTSEVQASAHAHVRSAIREALRVHDVDLIHFHGVDFPSYLPDVDVPMLATLHLPPHLYNQSIFNLADLRLICVSESQRRACPEGSTPISVIPNGVELEQFRYSSAKQDYALVLTRICPEKGVHCALQAAELAGMPLVIAGAVYDYPEHRAYFESQIRPRLNAERRFVGPANFKQKRDLLAEARCLLVPSLIDETSSLVTMEAMASGTPIVAFRRGALPELIEDGVTGFVVDSVAEMAEAMRNAGKIAPVACREYARLNFSADQCVRRYRRVYLGCVAARHLGAELGERTNV